MPILVAIHVVWPFFFATACLALEAHELLVVANRNAQGSVSLAIDYMAKRGVPEQNLLKIQVTRAETCTRADFDDRIAQPVREKLNAYRLSERPRCLVLMKGVPLKVGAVPLTKVEKTEIDGLNAERRQLDALVKQASDDVEKKDLEAALSIAVEKIKAFKWAHDTSASVDSELMLVASPTHPLPMWVPNPFYLGFTDKQRQVSKNDVIMVSRLDAPTTQIVQRIIDDAITAEKSGLAGTAYFDARYKDSGGQKVSGYGRYDQSIHLAAQRIRKKKLMPVVLNDTDKLFQSGDCPDAALYCGWYRLARYKDAFAWVPGAIGYHIASLECKTLRPGSSQVWCKRMLEEGVAVTIGPVEEPYVQAFPLPEIFFGVLAEGSLTVAESYLISVPYLSWKMVLVGDPLYRPFTNR